MAIESIYADAFLANLFKTDATLIGGTALNGVANIYRERAKQKATFPLLIYNLQAPHDYTTVNKDRLFSEYLYQCRIVGEVKGVDLQNDARVRAAANRMDELLNIRRRAFTVETFTYFFNIWRESELPGRREEPGEDESTFYRNYGGLYRVQVFK